MTLPHSFFRTLCLVLFAFGALTLVGCDSNDDDNDGGDPGDPNANATVTISGDLSVSFSGNAFAVYEGNNFSGLLISEGSIAGFNLFGTESVLLAWDNAAPISEQSYQINDSGGANSFGGGYFDYADQTSASFLVGTSGTITFTSISSSEVRGTFSFSGDVVQGLTQSGTASAQGSFTATVVRDTDFPDAP